MILEAIKVAMEGTIKAETGQVVDVTIRVDDKWTISGRPPAVKEAARWLADSGFKVKVAGADIDGFDCAWISGKEGSADAAI